MPKKTASIGKQMEGGRKSAKGSSFVAVCEGGCGGTTGVTLDVSDPHKSLTLTTPGWAALNAVEEGKVVFICRKCFEESGQKDELVEGDSDEEVNDAWEGQAG